jgi:hypothetical protein
MCFPARPPVYCAEWLFRYLVSFGLACQHIHESRCVSCHGKENVSAMNVYKHCETGAAGIFANWNYYNDEQTGTQSPQVHLLTGNQSHQFNFSSRLLH